LTFAQKNYGSVKKIASDKELEGILQKKSKEIAEYYQSKDYKNAVRTFLEISDAGNAYFQKAEPWRNPAEAEGKVGLCANVVRDLAIMVLPVMPQFSKKVLAVFGEKTEEIKSGGWKKIHLKWTGKLNVPELPACKIECLAMMPNSAGKEDKEENGKKEDKEKKDEKKTFPVQMRCGRIAEVSNHPNADSLYLLKVDFGGTVKQVVAGLRKYFAPEVLSGKKAVFCTNLKPAKIRGEASEAMILVADDGSKLSLLNVGEKVQQGAAAEFEGTASETKEISFEEFKKLILSTDAEGRIMFEGRKLWCAGAEVKASGVKEGARIG
jgi:methionyl-tRNA synthetase